MDSNIMPKGKNKESLTYEYLVEADRYILDGPLYGGMTGDMEDVINDESHLNNTHAVQFVALIPDNNSKLQLLKYARAAVPATAEHSFVRAEDLHLRLISSFEKFTPQRATSRAFTIRAKDVVPQLYYSGRRNDYVLLLTFRRNRLIRRRELLQKKTGVKNSVNCTEIHIALAFGVDPERVELPPWTSPITFGGYRNKYSGGSSRI